MESNPECSIVFNIVKFVDVDGNPIGRTAPPSDLILNNNFLTIEDYVNTGYQRGQWTVHTSSYFVRYKTYVEFTEHRTNDYSVFPYGDMAMLIYCLTHGVGYVVPQIMGCYRWLSGGYNSLRQKDAKFAAQSEIQLIKALDFVNEITGGVYLSQINNRIYRAKMNVAIKLRNRRDFFKLANIDQISKAYNMSRKRAYRQYINLCLLINCPRLAGVLARVASTLGI